MTDRPHRGAAGPQAARGGLATRYRLTVGLARADAARPAGVSVPSGSYRSLRRLPALAVRRISGMLGRPGKTRASEVRPACSHAMSKGGLAGGWGGAERGPFRTAECRGDL
jgi:hypothetical protein